MPFTFSRLRLAAGAPVLLASGLLACGESLAPTTAAPDLASSAPALSAVAPHVAATATTSFSIRVTTSGMSALVGRWVSDKGIQNSLLKKLEHASKETGKGRSDSLGSFINAVEAQSGKAITAEQAATLIALAKAV